MRKTVSVILLAFLLLSFCLTACTPETPKDPDPVPSSGQEKDPEEEPSGDYVIVSPSSKLAYKKACEAAEYELTEIVHHSDMHLRRFLLPCNKQFHERIVYAIDLMKELTKDYPVVVYTASTDGNPDYMEGTWQEVRKMNAGAISTGWMKDGGWYQRNISQKQGEDLGYYAMSYSDTDRIFFEILDDTLADFRTAGKPVDEEVVKAFKNVCTRLVCVETDFTGKDPWSSQWSAWMSTTTDVDSRMIEQIYYDIIGEGIADDGTNGNQVCIEMGRKPYLEVSTEDMKASLIMIADRYQEMAEMFPALKPYADRYTAYANAWNGVQ